MAAERPTDRWAYFVISRPNCRWSSLGFPPPKPSLQGHGLTFGQPDVL